MKIFCLITCLLIFALSQQVVYAQQALDQQDSLSPAQPATGQEEESAEGFIKLEMPLEEAFARITFVVGHLSGDGTDEIVFEGEGVTRQKDYIELSEHGKSWYRLLSKYAVESNQYIFVPVADWGGGSGVFYRLHVVDKKTLRTVDRVGLRDRARIEGITLAVPNSDIVSIIYIEREVKGDLIMIPIKQSRDISG